MGTDDSWVTMSNEKENCTNLYPLRNKVNTDQSNEKVMSDRENFLELQHSDDRPTMSGIRPTLEEGEGGMVREISQASSPVMPTTFPMTDMVNLISVALKLQSDAQAEQMRKERSALAEERNALAEERSALAEERKRERAEDRIREERREKLRNKLTYQTKIEKLPKVHDNDELDVFLDNQENSLRCMKIPEEYWTDALLLSMAGKYTEYATSLLVGDDTTYWDTKRRLLTAAGYTTAEAGNQLWKLTHRDVKDLTAA